jgi:hypothetical protein
VEALALTIIRWLTIQPGKCNSNYRFAVARATFPGTREMSQVEGQQQSALKHRDQEKIIDELYSDWRFCTHGCPVQTP